MNPTVARAEEALRQAKANAAAEERAVDTARLGKLRHDCRKAQDEYRRCENKFKRAEEFAARCAARFTAAEQAVTEHQPIPPGEYPTDAETAAWEREHKARVRELNEERDEYIKARDAREAARLEAVQAHGALEQLQWAERNLRNKLDGPVESSVSFVK